MSIEFWISSSPFFNCPRVHPCECGCIHEDSFFPILPGDGGFNFTVDGALVDLFFPGLKVGQIDHYLTIWWY